MDDVGMIFLEFLYYYGFIFDHTNYVIFTNIHNQESVLDQEISNYLNQNSHDIIIIDPLSKTNNVAKSTFQYANITVKTINYRLDGL
jgi:DNA polymerase sigma